MPTLKQAAVAFGVAILGTIVAGVVAFLNEVHLEVSFDKLKGFKVTDLASYVALGTALRFEVETAVAQDFVAFWVDDDDGKPLVRKSTISYKNFRLNNRIVGKLVDDDDKQAYAITGYYNTNRVVFAHRGPISGAGVYILDVIQVSGISRLTYAGFAIYENVPRSGSNVVELVQCPIIIVDEETALKQFPSNEAAKKAFPSLNAACTKFKMPENVTVTSAAQQKP